MRACWGAVLPSVIAVCLPMLALEASAETMTVPDGSGTWEMTITPAEAPADGGASIVLTALQETFQDAEEGPVPQPVEPADTAEPAEADEPLPTVTPAASVDPAAYWAVYRTIPFIRTEYLANPSYRHEATMEFLFGQLRPTVVHKHYQVRRPAPAPVPAIVPPYVYDRYLGQIPTFLLRYRPPAIPFGYPLSY
ncbi:MAG TPA: hypothetical protein VF170_15465 [Planctomycetaceae bacterium]